MGSIKKPAAYEANVHPDATSMPICIFCHGLGGMRTTYSGLCGNLASKGFIVAAIEFSDKSASRTSRFIEGQRQTIEYSHGDSNDRLEDESDQEYELRRRTIQTEHRVQETLHTLSMLENLGKTGYIKNNLIKTDFKYEQFKGRINFKNNVIMGHSFGVIAI